MKKATKRQVFLQLASAIMVLVLIISIAPAIAAEDGTGAAITPYAEYGNPNSNPNGRYLSDVLGISRQQYINHLTANQDKYLGTRYAGGSVMNYSWEYGPWWAKGYPSPTGYVGMNCGGFVAATFYNAGATNSNSAFMHSWYYSGYDLGQWSNAWTFGYLCYPSLYNLVYYDFPTCSEMIASGLLEKGDIIYTRMRNVDDHIGIFWGDTPSEDLYWHSASGSVYQNGNTVASGLTANAITRIGAKDTNPAFWRIVKFAPAYEVQVQKVSANTSITDGNSLYSLAGAVFGVYRNPANASADTDRVATLTTDASGKTNVEKVPFGVYYIKEITAPPGFTLNPDVYGLNMLTANPINNIYTITLSDNPGVDPVSLYVQKLNSSTNEVFGFVDQVGASLAGAQFTWRYYDGYFNTTEEAGASGELKRTWVTETDENGMSRLRPGWFVDGDSFYTNIVGDAVIPLGTVIIQETKAPDAYLLPDPNPTYILQIVLNDLDEVVTVLTKDGVPYDGDITNLNAIIIMEQPRSIKLIKTDKDTNERLEGALFALYKETEPGSGEFEQEALAQLRTDEDGRIEFSPLLPGTYKLVELGPPAGWILPHDTEEIITLLDSDSTIVIEKTNKQRDLEIDKKDRDTLAPIAGTEFTLYVKVSGASSSVTFIDPSTGHLVDAYGTWRAMVVLTTDSSGRVVYPRLTCGSYRLEETKPHPLYASAAESGEGPRYFEINPYSTNEVQVFLDATIQINCEVYKDTINITSAAFKTLDEDYLEVNNIGTEEFAYLVGFRSTSNVRADEFTVIDPMENAQIGQVRLTQLWTPVVYGDTDGRFNLWFRTNLTDPTQDYSSANAMASNPYNPNNPRNEQLYPSTGWQLWADGLSTTETTHLWVDDLGLAEDEYITGLRYEYGSVEVGFTSGNDIISTQQIWKPNLNWRPLALAGLSDDALLEGSLLPYSVYSGSALSASTLPRPALLALEQAAQATGLNPAYYLVVCPAAIEPPDEITSTVYAQIARNVVLTDRDDDHVVTTTIVSFMAEFSFDPPAGGDTTVTHFPQTGDHNGMLLVLGCSSLVLALFSLSAGIIRYRKRGASKHITTDSTGNS